MTLIPVTVVDPFLEDVGWEMTFNSARQRFQDVVHALYRKVRSQKEEIASTALKLQREGSREIRLEFADPLDERICSLSS